MPTLIRVFFIGLLITPLITNAGAWTQKKGSGYSHLSFMYVNYKALHNEPSAKIALRRKVTEMTLQGFVEYGITDRWTVMGMIPVKFIQTGSDTMTSPDFAGDALLAGGSKSGIGNVAVGARYKLFERKGAVLSASGNINAATASFDSITGIRTGYQCWGFAPAILLGYSVKGFWLNADAGVNLRTNRYSHEIFSSLELGYNIKEKGRYFLAGTLYVLQSMQNGSFDGGTSRQTGLYVNNQEYIAFNIKVGFQVLKNKNLGLWASFAGGIGQYVPSAPYLSGTISYSWSKKAKDDQ